MKEKITLAIYDENKLQKELLHHQFERMRFEVLYSTLKIAELKEYFEQRPAHVLLVNGANNLTAFISCLKNLRRRNGKLNIIFYNLHHDLRLETQVQHQQGMEAFFSTGGWANLITLIETFTDLPAITVKKKVLRPVELSPDSPFYNISENEMYIDILRYLKEGKSARQIAYLISTSVNNVNYHIRSLHSKTGSNTTKMVADAIKAGLI